MRPLRVLKQGVWYEIRSQINNREPLFHRSQALALFDQVFQEAKLRFVFRALDLRLKGDWLTFYIKPEDGMKLPAIMKWLKQTFAQRYNRLTGRIGHIWGDRYWSGILEGDPPEGASGGGGGAAPTTGVRPRGWKSGGRAALSAVSPASQVPPPG